VQETGPGVAKASRRMRSELVTEAMGVLPIRLSPGTDLSLGLEKVLEGQGEQAGWVLSGIGSLSAAQLRLADQAELTTAVHGPQCFPKEAPGVRPAWKQQIFPTHRNQRQGVIKGCGPESIGGLCWDKTDAPQVLCPPWPSIGSNWNRSEN
jgi:hypothetical protein